MGERGKGVMAVFNYVTSPYSVPSYLRGDTLYIDLETYGRDGGSALDIHSNVPRLLTLVARDAAHGDYSSPIYTFDLLHIRPIEILPLLHGKTLIGHNLLFDLAILRRLGLPYPPACRCTMLMSQILMAGLPEEYGHSGLQECLRRQLGIEITKGHGGDDWSVPQLSAEQLRYAAQDVLHLPSLDAMLRLKLDQYNLTAVANLENGILPAIVDMTLRGVLVDQVAWRERSKLAEVEAERLKAELLPTLGLPDPQPDKIVRVKRNGEPYAKDLEVAERIRRENETREWNLASPIQVMDAFRVIGVKLPDTRYETLTELQLQYPILEKFLAWREKYKEATTFGVGWLDHVHADGRVRPDWRQMGAEKSGRMSCGDPNLQQLPRGKCRRGIIARDGCVLVKADFSQIEARIAAKISGDPVLLEFFQSGGDIHTYTAQQVLQKDVVTKEDRQIGKSLLFGLLFSMSAPKLRVYCMANFGVRMTLGQAEVYRDRFFRAFPGLAKWHQRMRGVCEAKREFRTLLGRRRLVGYGSDRQKHINLLGLSLNHPVQGSAADLLKMCVKEMWDRREECADAEFVMLVHDEIVLECAEERSGVVGEWLKDVMMEAGRVLLKAVPVSVDVTVGKTWGG